MSSIPAHPDNLRSLSAQADDSYILKGLAKGKLGFIVSGPDVGKGYLCLSMAYELATDKLFVNLKAKPGIYRTLYWPIEDGVEEVAKRMLGHFDAMPHALVEQISRSVSLWGGTEPLCALRNGEDVVSHSTSRKKLIAECKQYDLLIIDTLREAAGNADEVDDDQVVKQILQEIAKEADIAIVLVHHLTKAAVRGLEKVSNVSGSGFSRTQANSRMHLYLEKVEKKGSQPERMQLTHIKANNIAKRERFMEEPLYWSESSLLVMDESTIMQETESVTLPGIDDRVSANEGVIITSDDISSDELEEILSRKKKIVEIEPREIDVDDSLLSPETIRKKRQQEDKADLVDKKERDALKQFLRQQRVDQKSG